MTKLAPYKVSKKHVAGLISLAAEKSAQLVQKPAFKTGDFVRIAKIDLPFRKGYKQNFTDEVFEISSIQSVNPPTYSLIDARGQTILGIFYQPELQKVQESVLK